MINKNYEFMNKLREILHYFIILLLLLLLLLLFFHE